MGAHAEDRAYNRCLINVALLLLAFTISSWLWSPRQAAFHMYYSVVPLPNKETSLLCLDLPSIHWTNLKVGHSFLLEISSCLGSMPRPPAPDCFLPRPSSEVLGCPWFHPKPLCFSLFTHFFQPSHLCSQVLLQAVGFLPSLCNLPPGC